MSIGMDYKLYSILSTVESTCFVSICIGCELYARVLTVDSIYFVGICMGYELHTGAIYSRFCEHLHGLLAIYIDAIYCG